jgi:hypothetical protein
MAPPSKQITQQAWHQVLATGDKGQIVAAAQQLAQEAMAHRESTQMCFLRWGGGPEHAIFYAPDTEARVPGHVYSPEGLKEVRISQSCEWCFDKAFDEDTTNHDVDHKGGTL